jgi:hypothetical protein
MCDTSSLSSRQTNRCTECGGWKENYQIVDRKLRYKFINSFFGIYFRALSETNKVEINLKKPPFCLTQINTTKKTLTAVLKNSAKYVKLKFKME